MDYYKRQAKILVSESTKDYGTSWAEWFIYPLVEMSNYSPKQLNIEVLENFNVPYKSENMPYKPSGLTI